MANGVRKSGNGYSYRIKRGNKTVEKAGFKTIKEASTARAKAVLEYESGTSTEFSSSKKVTLDEVYDLFINKEAIYDREKSTLKRYDSLYRNHLKPKWGDKKIEKVTAVQLTDYLFSLTETHSYNYIQSIQKFMKVLWTFATARGYVAENVVLDVKAPKKDSTPDADKIYTENELAIMEERFKSTNLFTAFLLAKELGVRSAECFGFTWSDVDWANKTIEVNCQMVYEDKMWCLRNTKTINAYRVINLQDSIYNYLVELKRKQDERRKELGNAYKPTRVAIDNGRNKPKTYRDNVDFINIRPNGDYLNTNSTKVLTRIADEELDIALKFHNLRHTHASKLAELNVPAVVVKNRLGHKKIETTLQYYTHITSGMTDNLLTALNSK